MQLVRQLTHYSTFIRLLAEYIIREGFMRILSVIIISTLVMGCGVHNASNIASKNRVNLQKLSFGMSPSEMLGIMGDAIPNAKGLNNPFRKDMFRKNEDVIEIYYYYSRRAYGPVTDDELTPVVFINGKLDGVGEHYFDAIINKYQIEVRSR